MPALPPGTRLPADRVHWYHRPVWVLLLLFVVAGPFGLPALWGSPRFSRPAKLVLTALVLAYTAMLAGETIRIVRILTRNLDVLG